ncbi:MAG: FtsX-like permease family protein [Caldilineae bacterium]|nr:MAG: FtsX-like permease family protein [Caldilineae bacterium]
MRFFKYMQVALESIIAHKMRAVLTMLGIIIGVAAVLTTMGIGRGAASDITGRITSQGTNLLAISPGASLSGGLSGGSGSAGTLTLADAFALQDSTLHPDVLRVAPEYTAGARLVYGSTNTQNQVAGVTADYATVRNLKVASGRFLTAEDSQMQRRVVVLGSELAGDLFAGQNPVGLEVRINGEPYQVIGVLEESGGGFNSSDTRAFVPIEVAQRRLFNAPRYRGEYTVTGINVEAVAEDRVDAAEREIEITLRLRHNLGPDDDNDFDIFNQASLLETLSSVTDTLTIFLGSIGAISLLVGGIGIMNIMLVSVTERTREIGLRRAVGAHDSDILLQFLVEALMLTFLGGVAGVGLAYGVASLFGKIPALTFTVLIQADSLALALGFSVLAGLIFGIYPAIRATQLDPIEALRSE